jgi:hypothetical protein
MYGMQLMQYEITLPADYDMGIIRRRVQKAAPLLDDFDRSGTARCAHRRGRHRSKRLAVDPVHAVGHEPR